MFLPFCIKIVIIFDLFLNLFLFLFETIFNLFLNAGFKRS